jgi:hypothetical protein
MASPWRRASPDYGTYAKKPILAPKPWWKPDFKRRGKGEPRIHARARRGIIVHTMRRRRIEMRMFGGEWRDVKARVRRGRGSS